MAFQVLCCCDVSFCDVFVRFYLLKSKTDVHGAEAHILLTKVDSFLVILYRYICTANLDLCVLLLFIRSLQFLKATIAFSFRYMGMKFARTGEIVIPVSAKFGYPNPLLIFIA